MRGYQFSCLFIILYIHVPTIYQSIIYCRRLTDLVLVVFSLSNRIINPQICRGNIYIAKIGKDMELSLNGNPLK